jgi:hypothetical protein
MILGLSGVMILGEDISVRVIFAAAILFPESLSVRSDSVRSIPDIPFKP